MWTPLPLADGSATGYALGWHVATTDGRREVHHSGSQPGTSSFLFLRPDERLAVMVLSNLGQVDFHELTRRIAGEVESPPERPPF